MDIQEQVLLSDKTTFRLGGPARFFVSVTSLPELREAVAFAQEHKHPILILGGGSNMVIMETGWSGLVIHVALMGRVYDEDSQGDVRAVVGAGEPWDAFVEETVRGHGLWGLENLSLIPGTVGATPVQNVGAYGVEVQDVIEWVEVFDTRTGELSILSNNACQFGYRDSLFKKEDGKHFIVTRVAYRLSTQANPKLTYKDLHAYFSDRKDVTPREVRDVVCEIRRGKFPDLTQVGTAGSFFKNPIITQAQLDAIHTWAPDMPAYRVADAMYKIPLAWVLEHLGYKGKQQGAFGCYKAQPLVVIHYGNGTPSELVLFAHNIVRAVKEKFAITIEPEVRIISSE